MIWTISELITFQAKKKKLDEKGKKEVPYP
jgi:hypothetical protein